MGKVRTNTSRGSDFVMCCDVHMSETKMLEVSNKTVIYLVQAGNVQQKGCLDYTLRKTHHKLPSGETLTVCPLCCEPYTFK